MSNNTVISTISDMNANMGTESKPDSYNTVTPSEEKNEKN